MKLAIVEIGYFGCIIKPMLKIYKPEHLLKGIALIQLGI